MKIAVIQCDVVAGDLGANAEIIAAAVKKCAGADLCVAPALALAGPLAPCVLKSPDFQDVLSRREAELARALESSPPLVYGGSNGCRLLQNGIAISPAGEFFLQGKRVCCLPLVGDETGKDGQPKADTGKDGQPKADLVCCPAAIPFTGRPMPVEKLGALAKRQRSWLVLANLVGGYDSAIYPGGSLAFDDHGRLRECAPTFAEHVIMVDEQKDFLPREMPVWNRMEAILQALVLGIRDFTRKCGAKGVLLGLSGGMDSALVATLAAEALGAENVTGLMMPSPFSSAGSVGDSRELAANLGIKTLELPIGDLMAGFDRALEPVYGLFVKKDGDVTGENIQARIRGLLLSAASNRSGALVLNTGNKSEAATGYFTLYGDSTGALAVIGDLYKTEVYELAGLVNDRAGKKLIPQNIFDKAPSAELAPNQKDEDSLPPYGELDGALRKVFDGRADDAASRQALARLFGNEFKRRQCPPALIISDSPLAACRRPIAGRMDF